MKHREHKIIVLIPFRNAGHYIVDCINSILGQSYENYEAFLLNDASDDNTLDFIDYTTDKITLLTNEKRLGALQSIYLALTTLKLNDDDIIVLLDGDDFLLGEHVFKMLNIKYNEKDFLITYGQFISNIGIIGHCSPYSRDEFESIRRAPWKASHLKTFKFKLFKTFLSIDPDVSNYKSAGGQFYMTTSDQAIMFPLLEIAGYERSFCFPNILYCYRIHSNNDHATEIGRRMQLEVENEIRSKIAIQKKSKKCI